MRKKYIVISMAMVMALCMAGCGKTTNNNSTNTTEAGYVSSESDSESSVKVTNDDDMFTDRDYDTSYDDAEKITLADGASSTSASGVEISGDVITITKAGSYKLSGTLTDGQIIIDCADDDKVQLVLDGVDITNDDSAVIYVKNADKVFITTTSSDNSLTVTGEFAEDEDGVDAVIYAKDDITFNGTGTLDITSETSHGIVGKDDVKITSGTYNITAAKKGIDANDSVRVADGEINITSGTDGIHVENTDDTTLGYFYAIGGTFNIDAGYDGIDASGELYIYDGEYNITSGGGSDNGVFHTGDMMGGFGQGGFGGQEFGQENFGQQGGFDGQMPDFSDEDFAGGMQEGNFGQGGPGGHGGPGGQGGFGGGRQDGQRHDMADSEMPDMGDMTPPDMADGEMPDLGDMTPPDMADGEVPDMGDMIPPDMADDTVEQTDDNSVDEAEEEYDADDYTENSTKGIKADGGIYISGGTFNIDSADDTLHSDNVVVINDGTITISSGDDGIHADVSLTINGGNIDIETSYEGIEASSIELNGGTVNLVASDDGLNAGGGTDATLTINGGEYNLSAGGDGVDSNGTLLMTGGTVYLSGPNNGGNGSIDYEVSGSITGGTFVSAGASGMALNFGSDSTQCSILYELSSSVSSGTKITLTDASGNVIVSYTPDKDFQSIIISSPEIESDGTYTLTVGSDTYTIEMSGTIYGQGSGMGMGGFGR
ncbi:MAG: carbohydrate-binding domain-containing protein [Lachnospiraceae bacterium]|nr:carbohydrate-binding domain-containing protein [Lachnospiraceae bacterium]